jgi:hypothetical protein
VAAAEAAPPAGRLGAGRPRWGACPSLSVAHASASSVS